MLDAATNLSIPNSNCAHFRCGLSFGVVVHQCCLVDASTGSLYTHSFITSNHLRISRGRRRAPACPWHMHGSRTWPSRAAVTRQTVASPAGTRRRRHSAVTAHSTPPTVATSSESVPAPRRRGPSGPATPPPPPAAPHRTPSTTRTAAGRDSGPWGRGGAGIGPVPA